MKNSLLALALAAFTMPLTFAAQVPPASQKPAANPPANGTTATTSTSKVKKHNKTSHVKKQKTSKTPATPAATPQK